MLRGRGYRVATDAAGVRRYTTGWEFVHIAIDDCTRLAYAEVLPNEKASTAIAFGAATAAGGSWSRRRPGTC